MIHNSNRKPLPLQRLFQHLREMLVVGLGVAVLGEDLREVVAVGVLFENVGRFLGVLLLAIELVNALLVVVVVNLPMHKGLHGQLLRQGGLLHGIAHRDTGHGDDVLGQLQRLHELIDVVGDGAEPYEAEPEGFGGHAGVLGGNQRVGDGPVIALQVAVSFRVGVAEPAVLVEPAEVGAEGEDHRRGGRHRLVEMERRELGLHLLVAGHNDAEQLHVAHRGAAAGRLEDQVQGFLSHRTVAVLAHADMVEEGFQCGVISGYIFVYHTDIFLVQIYTIYEREIWLKLSCFKSEMKRLRKKRYPHTFPAPF